MELIVVAVVVVLVAAIAFLGLRRRSTDDVHSVEHYRQTLTTLQSVRTRSQGSGVRVIGGPESPPGAPGEPEAGGNGALGSGAPHFEDPAVSGTLSERELRSSRRRQDRAIASMNRRPRRLAAPLASAVVVVAVVAALAVVGARQRHHNTGSGSHGTNALHATTTAPHSGSTGGTTATTAGTTSHHHRGETTTTLPLRFAAQSSTATTATYLPPSENYALTVGATTAECWLSVTSQANGKVLFEGILDAGQQQQVQASGVTTVAIGAPSVVAVSLDEAPVVLPEGYQSPFTMTFQPAATGSTSTTSASG